MVMVIQCVFFHLFSLIVLANQVIYLLLLITFWFLTSFLVLLNYLIF